MSTYSAGETGTQTTRDYDDSRNDSRPARRGTTETKSAFKTTEFVVYVLAVAGVLVASAMVDQNADGQGFGADHAWLYVTLLSIGYMISRGLAKAGSYEKDHDSRH